MIRTFIYLIVGLLLVGQSCIAQDYPTKSIRLIVTSAPGSGIDSAARIVAQSLSESFKQAAIVDNRVGASGQIGGAIAAKASPDGYTILVVSPVFLISQHLYKNIPYDFVKDFAPVTRIGKTPYVMVISPALPTTTLKEFIAYAKSHPGKINYGSNGSGTIMHLAGELLKSVTGIDVVHVSYKSSTQVVSDVVGNRLEMMFNSVTLLAPFIRDGRVRAMAVGSQNRSSLLPNVSTFAELGFNGIDVASWYGFVVPVGTPKPVVSKLQREITKFINSPTIKERFQAVGTETLSETPEQFSKAINIETDRYGRIVKAAGVTK